MNIELSNIGHEYEIIDDKYIEAILESSKELLEFYLNEALVDDNQIDVTAQLARFWPYLATYRLTQIQSGKFKLYILPLHRVGATEGASGGKVLVCYFTLNNDSVNISNPLILKYQDIGGGKENKIDREKKQADSLKPYTRDRFGYFAFPVMYNTTPDNTIAFLWAPFSSSIFREHNGPGGKPTLKEDNLWKKFDQLDIDCTTENLNDQITKSLNDIYTVLFPIHIKSGRPNIQVRKLPEEYSFYLRGLERWWDNWSAIWGKAAEKYIKDFNSERINPFYVYNKLKDFEANLSLGAIHGDLHTKNIVFAPGGRIRIIDFGWSNAESHLAKDFILIESNLRFMVLHPDMPFSDIEKLCTTLDQVKESKIDYQCKYSGFIHKLIFQVRENAFKVLKEDKLYEEYLIPLFLVCLGLLKFSKSFNNIISARLTILEMAKLIDEYLNKIEDGK